MNYTRDLFMNRWSIALILSFAAVEGYSLFGLPALVQIQQSRVKDAEAANADELREAERIDTQAKAKLASEVARYAEHNQSAIARLKTAQADIAASGAKIAQEAANNAALKALADAKLQQAQNELNQAKLVAEDQKTYHSARLEKATACDAQIKAYGAIFGNFLYGNRVNPTGGMLDWDRLDRSVHYRGYDPTHNPCGDPPMPEKQLALAAAQRAAAANSSPLQQPANSEPSSTNQRARIVARQMNVHVEPDINAPTLGHLDRGAIVEITKAAPDAWVNVKGTCLEGNPCSGFIRDRSQYLVRLP